MKKYFNIFLMIVAIVIFVITINEIYSSDLSWDSNYRNYLRIILSAWIFFTSWGKVFPIKSNEKVE